MAIDAGELVVKISADIAEMKAALQIVTQNIGEMGKTTDATGVAMGITFSQIIDKVLEFGQDSVKAFEQAQLTMTRLAFFVGNDASKSFQEFSDRMEETTSFSHQSVLALESQLSAYGVLPGSVEEATQAILGYAAATGKDLPDAASVFARAIQGQSRELKQYGLTLNQSDSQSAHMDQTIAFLNTRFGGMAETIKGTVVGQIETLKNKLDALKEAAGHDIVNAIGFWGSALKTVAGALGITDEKMAALTRSMGGQATVRQLAIDKLREERDGIITEAKNIADLDNSTVQLSKAQQDRIVTITREIASLKQKETQEKVTSDAGVKGVAVVQTKAQQAVAERIASMKLELQTDTEVENHIQELTTLTTNVKIEKSKLELQQIQADQLEITRITDIETQKRLATSQQSWEANASFSDQFRVKLYDDLSKITTSFADMAMGAVDSFSKGVAHMIVEGGKFSDVISNLWKSLAEEIIAQIIRMIAEWIIFMSLTGGGGFGLGFMADGGMINEPSVIRGLKTGNVHVAGEAGPEMVMPMSKMGGGGGGGNYSFASAPSGGGGGGGGSGDGVTINISGQFLEGSQSKWQQLVQQYIAPEIRRLAMKDPNSLITRKRGALS